MSAAISDLRDVIVHAIDNDPRTLQTALGPSDIANGCDRCLAHVLAGHARREQSAAWLPTIGRAFHEWAETAVLQHLASTGSDRYLPEVAVTVGRLRGLDVTGHSDLYDVHTGTVVDYKLVGKTTIDQAKRGPKATYRNQIHLYGKGIAALGHNVRDVAVWYLPRNAISLDAGHVFTEPYDAALADAALARANAIAAGVDSLGADAVLEQMPPHTGQEFTCTQWATDPSTATVAEVTPDAFLGV